MLDPSFFGYVTVMSITPGPNNLLLATSGANFGLRRTLPMLTGISLGCGLQTLLATMLLELLLQTISQIRLPLTLLGCGYLFWLCWKLCRSSLPERRAKARPGTLLTGILFQTVNPKTWLMASNIALLYSASSGMFILMFSFIALNLPCILIWALMGDRLRHHLQVEWKLKLFNGVMAGALLVTTLWMLIELLPPN